jgi:hypothetical protein
VVGERRRKPRFLAPRLVGDRDDQAASLALEDGQYAPGGSRGQVGLGVGHHENVRGVSGDVGDGRLAVPELDADARLEIAGEAQKQAAGPRRLSGEARNAAEEEVEIG